MLMASKLVPSIFPWLILPTCILIFLYSALLPLYSTSKLKSSTPDIPIPPPSTCNHFKGKWVFDPTRRPMYDSTCPFHRNAWNCIKNQREKMGRINSWKWVPENCELNVVDPVGFLNLMRNRNIGFVGDSLNENFLVSFLCISRVADAGATKWKRKGAWRGAYFPKFNVTVAYHRAVLLAKYEYLPSSQIIVSLVASEKYLAASLALLITSRWQTKQPKLSGQDGTKGMYRVDVDIPADDWANIAEFYDVLVFNTGHWWGEDKFPKETPLVFFQGGQPIHPPLNMLDGLNIVLENMVDHIEKTFPKKTLKFWRLQSPRHFRGGEWNQNGSCLFEEPLKELQLDLWFDPSNGGVNKEARQLNHVIEASLRGTSIRILDLTHLSEFRADAHPAVWLGKNDSVSIWGQDCMHWCLPGVPDTWVDILTQLISDNLGI